MAALRMSGITPLGNRSNEHVALVRRFATHIQATNRLAVELDACPAQD